MKDYENLQDAYVGTLTELRSAAQFSNEARGYPTTESLGVCFRISRPSQRHIAIRARRTNIVFSFAEALWYLSGRDDLATMTYYAPGIMSFLAGSGGLAGSAYGPRIFNRVQPLSDQWTNVIRVLTADAGSRRAVIQILSVDELLDQKDNDVACTIALQYLARQGSLHAVTYMRSNDAYRGVVSDIFSFSLLQEILAKQLELSVGTYTHFAGSYHFYATDVTRVDQVLAGATDVVSNEDFPEMPTGDNWPDIRTVIELESALRLGRVSSRDLRYERIGLHWYWEQVVRLFAAFSDHKRWLIDRESLDALHPLYASLCRNLWPAP